jgi:subtilisin family serine protease
LVVGSNSYAAPDRRAERARIAPEYSYLQQKLADEQAIPVIVRFKVDKADGRSAAARREAARQRFTDSMARESMVPTKELRLSGLSVYVVDAQQLDTLLDNNLVDTVWEDKLSKPHLQQSNALINTDIARDYGVNGNGAAVAILDTGIDAAHSTFDNRVVAEACFSTRSGRDGATSLCPNGSQSQTGTGSAATTKCTDVPCWHGTHVASIAAGSNSTYTGVAPQADIVAIQVFSRFNNDGVCGTGASPCVASYSSDQIDALEHVAGIASTHNIAAVNMSLGGGQYTSVCTNSPYDSIVDTLESLDVIIVASSGNSYYSNALGSPACASKIFSVGSVIDTTDGVSSFSNSASFLDILAPGQTISAAVPGGGYGTASGTSMAAPHVAGAIALIKSEDGSLTHAQMKSALLDNGTPVLDTRNGLTFPRLEISLALFGVIPGDANDDGKVDVADLLLVQKHVTGVAPLTAAAVMRCDLYPAGGPDGALDAADLVLLQQLLQAM